MRYVDRNGAAGEDQDPLSEKVIAIALEIHRELGTGFHESIYQHAMEIDLAEAGIAFESEVPLTATYKGHILGHFSVDLIVEGKLLIDLKAVEMLPVNAELQVFNYLKAADLEFGLLLNFGMSTLQIRHRNRLRESLDLLTHET